MRIITAVEPLMQLNKPTVFLAGGITNCPEWQDEIIELLSAYDCAVLFNPRRKCFPIHDPNAAKEQITWEFDALRRADIFSMWFSNADSDQPICMYELGRHLALRQNYLDTVVIGVEPGYRRSQDVHIQSGLVDFNINGIATNLDKHAENILSAINMLLNPEVTQKQRPSGL